MANLIKTDTAEWFYKPDAKSKQVFDMTGKPVALEEYQARTNQPGKTEQQTDFSKVKNAPLPALNPNSANAAPATSAPSTKDPFTVFNTTLLNMLKSAQGVDNKNLYMQERALQRKAIERSSSMTPEELRTLSPGQQNAIRSGSVQALEPEIDAVSASIKSQNQRLVNFENMLDSARSIGGDIMSNIAPSKEVLEGYKEVLYRSGDISSIPSEIRSKVVASMSPEDWGKVDTEIKRQEGIKKKTTIPDPDPMDTTGEVRAWLIDNKNKNKTVPWFDLWGQLTDQMKGQGLNPTNYDDLLWEVLHPQGAEGYKAEQEKKKKANREG